MAEIPKQDEAGNEVADAWRDIFNTFAGKIAFQHLHAIAMQTAAQGIPSCALHDFNGMRRLAVTLMNFATPEAKRDSAGIAIKQSASGTGRGTRRRGPARDIAGGRRP